MKKNIKIYLLVLSGLMLAGCGKNELNHESTASSSAQTEQNKGADAKVDQPHGDVNIPDEKYVEVDSAKQLIAYHIYYAPIDGAEGARDLRADIAENISAEYRETSDKFKKQDILNKIMPKIDELILFAKQHPYFFITQEGRNFLQEYDFKSKSFPNAMKWQPSTSLDVKPQETSYSLSILDRSTSTRADVILNNNEDYEQLVIKDETVARNLEDARVNSKLGEKSVRFYLYASKHPDDPKILAAEIMKIKIFDDKGNELYAGQYQGPIKK